MYENIVHSSWFSRVDSNKLLPMTSNSVRKFEDNLPSNLPSLISSKSMHRGSLKTRLSFILHCINLSAGLGNIWRFPNLAYENKGVNFLIPYAILVVFAGNPLFFLEVGIGQYAGCGPLILGKMAPVGKGFAAAMTYISILTVIYYGALMTHCMTYILISFYSELPWTACTNSWKSSPMCWDRIPINISDTTGRELRTPAEDFYSTYVLDMDKNVLYEGLGKINENLLVYLGITWLIIFCCLIKGKGKGLKWVTYTASVAPIIMLGVLVSVAVHQQGSIIGIRKLFDPRTFEMPDIKAWRRAVEQMFYSLDVSSGNLIMYGACCEFRSSSLKDVLIVTTLDLIVSVASGTIVFSILGALSYETNIDFYFCSHSGAGIVFVGFSEVIVRMPAARFWNFIIFSCLYFVCLETQFSCLDPVFSSIFALFPILKTKRTLTTGILCFILFLLGIPCITKSGVLVITLMDDIGAAMGLVFIGILETIFVTGIYGVHRFSEDMHFMLGSKPSIFWKILWVICPIFLCIIMLQCALQLDFLTYLHIELPLYAVILGWLSCLTGVVIVLVVGLFQVAKYFFKGELGNVIRPTPEWCPDSELLAKARSMFNVFNSTENMRQNIQVRRRASGQALRSVPEALHSDSTLLSEELSNSRLSSSSNSVSTVRSKQKNSSSKTSAVSNKLKR